MTKEERKVYSAAWRARNRQKCRDRYTAWRAANPEKARAATAAWREAHREEDRAKHLARYHANREERMAQARAWKNANAAAVKDYARTYRAAHADERRVRHKTWYDANAERERAKARPRAAAYNAEKPRVGIAGERVRVGRLPEELRPIARLILETRREIRGRKHSGGNEVEGTRDSGRPAPSYGREHPAAAGR